MSASGDRLVFATVLVLTVAAAILVAIAVGVIIHDTAAVLLAIGLTPIGWAIAVAAFEIRRGTDPARAALRSVPMALIGLVFCFFFACYALRKIGL